MPAIGVAAAYGLLLSVQRLGDDEEIQKGKAAIRRGCEYLESARPTAVNLFWALEKTRQGAQEFIENEPAASLKKLKRFVLKQANDIRRLDIESCRKIGENGQKFIRNNTAILTHCNAGALATAGQGTALSVIYSAKRRGKRFRVYVGETRPLLQGARLTCWELKQARINAILICDSMAGWLMKQGKIDAVITGADRIAANGDAANKIGTYGLSVLARENKVPFYIAAPVSTFDRGIKSGRLIPIEHRPADEVTSFAGRRIAPRHTEVWNPAFDITDAGNITAIITERGVIEKPNAEKIARHLA